MFHHPLDWQAASGLITSLYACRLKSLATQNPFNIWRLHLALLRVRAAILKTISDFLTNHDLIMP